MGIQQGSMYTVTFTRKGEAEPCSTCQMKGSSGRNVVIDAAKKMLAQEPGTYVASASNNKAPRTRRFELTVKVAVTCSVSEMLG